MIYKAIIKWGDLVIDYYFEASTITKAATMAEEIGKDQQRERDLLPAVVTEIKLIGELAGRENTGRKRA